MKILKEEKLKTTFKKPTPMGKKLQNSIDTNMRIKGVKPSDLKEGYNNPDYEFYIFNTKSGKIESGWEYKDDAIEIINDNEMDKKIYKVLSGKFLKSKGIDPKEDKNWGVVEETTTASSSGSYETKFAWAKSPESAKFAKKPIYQGGTIIQENLEDALKSYQYHININQKYIDQIDQNPELKNEDEIMELYNEKKSEIGEYEQKMQDIMNKLEKEVEVSNIEESTDKDKYENVIFLQGHEANEALQILDEKGEDAALEYLKQWHDYGNHEGTDQLGHGTYDEVYEKDGYIMAYNPNLGYIGLQYEFEVDESVDALTERYEKLIQESPIEYQRLYRSLLRKMGARKVKDLTPRQKKRFFSSLKSSWKALKEKLKNMEKKENPIEKAQYEKGDNVEDNIEENMNDNMKNDEVMMLPEGYEDVFDSVMREMGYEPDEFEKLSSEEKSTLFDTIDKRFTSKKEKKYMKEHHADTREEMIDFLVKASKFVGNPVPSNTFDGWGDADIEVMYSDIENMLRDQGELETVMNMNMDETTSAGGGASGDYTAALQMKENDRELTEKAPPGMEDFINDAKPSFKKQYGNDWEKALYATAWEKYNEKNESTHMNEEKKPATTLQRDQIHKKNTENFKSDLKKYDSIDTDINKAIKKKEEFVDITMNGDGDAYKQDELKKFQPTTKLEKDIMLNRGKGMEDIDYDLEPSEGFEERRKEDQKEKYEQGEEKKEYRKNQPMYNKDAQPVMDEEKYEKKMEKNESVYATYRSDSGKRHLVEFEMKDVKTIDSKNFNKDAHVKLYLDGMGNSYDNKVKLKESFVKEFKNYDFYLNKETDKIVKIKETTINESTDELNKMKRLFNYNPKSFI